MSAKIVTRECAHKILDVKIHRREKKRSYYDKFCIYFIKLLHCLS
jgi:hypothetical protein